MSIILHIDFNSYFASVEQQANPRLRGKPIGITGGDRMERTVLSTASVEAKKRGVKTGMQIWEAKRVCPEIIIVCSDHDKYLSVTTKFLNIFKDYTDKLEIFSIDECFIQISKSVYQYVSESEISDTPIYRYTETLTIAADIKSRLKSELGPCITCSIGISYNKLMAKLAGSLKKPDGLVIIPDQKTAIEVLDTVELDEVCGIGPRIKRRLFNMGVKDFKSLRQVPKECLLASFKSYGEVLYNMARGIDNSIIIPFDQKEEIKSVGHRHTLDYDINHPYEIKQVLLKLTELVSARLRNKSMVGKTIHCWYRTSLRSHFKGVSVNFEGDGMQRSLGYYTNDGLAIFKIAWEIFHQIWHKEDVRMIGVSVSNLKSELPATLSLLPETKKRETMLQAMDKINNKFGDFTLQRGTLLTSCSIQRKPNPFLSDRRFKL